MYVLLFLWFLGTAYCTYARRRNHETTSWASIPKYFLTSSYWPLMLLLFIVLLAWPVQKE